MMTEMQLFELEVDYELEVRRGWFTGTFEEWVTMTAPWRRQDQVRKLNQWFPLDEDYAGELWLDGELRLWVPTYHPSTDAITGSHTVGRVPAAQRYAMRFASWKYHRWMAEMNARGAAQLAEYEQDDEPF